VRLQTRLAMLFGAVVIAAAVLMGTLSYVAMASRLQAQIDQSLLGVSTPLARELAAGDLPPQLVEDHDGRDGRGGRGGSDLVLPTQVLLPDGTVVADPQYVALPTDEQDRAIARSPVPALRFADTVIDSRPYRMVTQSAGGARGAVQVGRDVSENARVLSSLAWLLSGIGLLVAVLAALAGWLVARRTSARLVELTDTAERVAATGRLDTDVPVSGTDEVARLAASFNAMLVRLGQARDDQQRLVQDAGHELRTPLTSLRTNVSLLRQFEAMPPEVRDRVIADLDGETRELTALVDEVVTLAVAVPADTPRTAVELAALARSVGARAYRRTGRRVSLQVDDSVVVGHAALLARAMWNLVDNACKFSGGGAPIELDVHRGTVVVRDAGPGIDPVDLDHVFDRFYRSASARALPGSGLGLAIVRDVAESHGGRAFAANRPEGGAEVGFWVPVASGAPGGPDQGR
jgi:two-component system, OmpR family, sensor histidine kinase MprB